MSFETNSDRFFAEQAAVESKEKKIKKTKSVTLLMYLMVNCLLTFLKGKSTLFLEETKRFFTWREEDPNTRKILQGGSS